MKKGLFILITLLLFPIDIRATYINHRYCQYDVDASGSPYVIGTCDIYIDGYVNDNDGKYRCNFNYSKPSYISGVEKWSQEPIYLYNYNYINKGYCPDFIRGLVCTNWSSDSGSCLDYGYKDNYNTDDTTQKHEYSKFTSDDYSANDIDYFCKVGSTNWCKVPTNKKYYSIVHSSNDDEWTCQYTDYLDESGTFDSAPFLYRVTCSLNDGCELMNWTTDQEVVISVEKFLDANGKPYCPKIEVSDKPLITDEGSAYFFNQIVAEGSSSSQVKYCSYPLIKKDKNQYMVDITLTYRNGELVAVNPNITKRCSSCATGVCASSFSYMSNYDSESIKSILLTRLKSGFYDYSNGCPDICITNSLIAIEDENNNTCSPDLSYHATLSNQQLNNREFEYISCPQSGNNNGNGSTIPGQENDRYSDVETCTDVDVNHIKACGCIPAEVADITSKVYFILRLIGPIILLIIGGFEMAKAIAAQDESAIEKAKKKLVNKFIAAAAIFLVLTIIKLAVSLVAGNTSGIFKCVNILLDGYVI